MREFIRCHCRLLEEKLLCKLASGVNILENHERMFLDKSLSVMKYHLLCHAISET